ncbi:glycoside hydrolase family 127 protein [Amantichitinum ursilacus]|uniref:Non-reducing end beta-L-arabinofuranosidase n=1 Tax=Amantichitinum ursilacus TaxID=857265 RepID=A0A0N1JTB3_9NEIS|nr:beta-L-arabinofuranosidase domain-containing protein [Amantichitinum ursilacus]KPC53427.1 Non-reducing end beta-L-arabinofuranosidase [Amantichitinum ursilacus]
MNLLQQAARPRAINLASSPFARLLPVSPLAVTLGGQFWGPRQARNARVSLLTQFEQLEEWGNLDNFRRLQNPDMGPFRGKVFNDTDVYKWIEAVCWVLAVEPSPRLQEKLDLVLDLIEAAQCADGYLNTWYAVERADERWSNLRDNHELYCAGHLLQAAVAHHRTQGNRRLLNVAIRFADLICAVFGSVVEGKNPGIDGHEEIELALVELYRETGNAAYLRQAEHFIDARGYGQLKGGWFGLEYFQDHAPLRKLNAMAGHAVRALYYNSGAADVFLETGDPSLLQTLTQLWRHMQAHQIYISGGLGSRHHGEALGADYELPNAQAYTETCAAIGSMMWNQRMLAATGDAQYAELIEHTLYNAMLPGWSLDGKRYFYVNPLANDGSHSRQTWYECACCPPNVARTIAALSGSVYSTSPGAIWVHLYADNTADIDLEGWRVGLTQKTRYPWDGDIEITVDASHRFDLMLRIPTWAGPQASVSINGKAEAHEIEAGQYLKLQRVWQPGDRIRISLPMPVRVMQSHPHVLENAGRVALMRGPLLYCVEAADHPGVSLLDIELPTGHDSAIDWEPELLDGVVVLRLLGRLPMPERRWNNALYQEQGGSGWQSARDVQLTAIPYYAWHNRAAGPMQVWLKQTVPESTYG